MEKVRLNTVRQPSENSNTPQLDVQGEPPAFQNVSVHDPSIIKDGDTYYVFGTHIEAAKSPDLMSWTRFTNGYTTPGNVSIRRFIEQTSLNLLLGPVRMMLTAEEDLLSGLRKFFGMSTTSMRTEQRELI